MHKDFYKIQKELEQNTIYQENNQIDMKLFDILKWNNRENWYNEIVPLVKSVDLTNRTTTFSTDDNTGFYSPIEMAFLPEELDINYQWKFKVRDIITDGDDIMVITHMPEVYIGNTDYLFQRLKFNGNTYWIIRLDENGNDIDINDPTYYLHNYFNENQIWKVDEEIEKKYKELMKDKKYYIDF